MYSTYSKLYQYCTGSSPAIVDCNKFIPPRLSSYQIPAETVLYQSSDNVAARAWTPMRLGTENSYRYVDLVPDRLAHHVAPNGISKTIHRDYNDPTAKEEFCVKCSGRPYPN